MRMKKNLNFQTDFFYNFWVVLAVAMTFLNNHFFKSNFPPNLSFLTGKLSDFGGLFFVPIFLVYLAYRFFGFTYNRWLIFWCCLMSSVQFVLFKFVDFFRLALINLFDRHLFSIQIVSDPSDLLALISPIIAALFLQKYLPTNVKSKS
jgi:hypothetical protein